MGTGAAKAANRQRPALDIQLRCGCIRIRLVLCVIGHWHHGHQKERAVKRPGLATAFGQWNIIPTDTAQPKSESSGAV